MAVAGRRDPQGWALGRAQNPELRLAASAARFSTIAAGPVLSCAWLAAGTPGLVGAAIAAALVTALLWGSAVVLTVLARRGGSVLMVGVLGGFLVRLIVTAALLAALAQGEGINRSSLALSGIVLVAATLVWESWQASRAPGFFWVTPASSADRSERIHA
ncbi:MAG: hypothetical protein ACRDTT_16450 [Pseudonocardiaceae bacterium]